MITLQENNGLSIDKWLLLRNESIGASEGSPICFGSKYTSNIEIFYQKVTGIKKNVRNIRTYTGHKSENIVDQFYPYYDGTEESIYLNEESGKIIRSVENRNVTGKNSKFPHLTATPDRFTLYLKSQLKKITEYKNTQSWVLKQWLPGLPLDNVIQLLIQLNIFEMQYGELFYYIDNMKFQLHEMDANSFKKQWQIVLERTIPFWENVKKARILYNQKCEASRNFNMKLANELDHEIQLLEPPIQHSAGYLKYINENYKSRASLGGKEATAAEIEKAIRYKKLAKQIDKLKKEQEAIEVDLKVAMKEAKILHLGKSGTVTWNEYNDRKVFKINVS